MVLVNYLNNEYLFIFIFLVVVIIISAIALGLSYSVVYQDNYLEKISVYECGFEPFEDTRVRFDVRFYLVSILFIIFDIEIMFLFP
jgi:NADH-quinone oxidoreductase subunit A